MVAISVDHMCIPQDSGALSGIGKVAMNVPMDKVSGSVLVDEFAETVKSPVTGIFPIVNVTRWRMGEDDIQRCPPTQRAFQATNEFAHLRFGILMGPTVIPMGTFQSKQG